jgi:hypothetical protein
MPSKSFLEKKKIDDQLVYIFGRKNCWFVWIKNFKRFLNPIFIIRHWIGNDDTLRRFGVDDSDLIDFRKNSKLKKALDEAQEAFLSLRSRKYWKMLLLNKKIVKKMFWINFIKTKLASL